MSGTTVIAKAMTLDTYPATMKRVCIETLIMLTRPIPIFLHAS